MLRLIFVLSLLATPSLLVAGKGDPAGHADDKDKVTTPTTPQSASAVSALTSRKSTSNLLALDQSSEDDDSAEALSTPDFQRPVFRRPNRLATQHRTTTSSSSRQRRGQPRHIEAWGGLKARSPVTQPNPSNAGEELDKLAEDAGNIALSEALQISRSLCSRHTARYAQLLAQPLTSLPTIVEEENETASTTDFADTSSRGKYKPQLAAFKAAQQGANDDISSSRSEDLIDASLQCILDNLKSDDTDDDDDSSSSSEDSVDAFLQDMLADLESGDTDFEFGQTASFKSGSKGNTENLETKYHEEVECAQVNDATEPTSILKQKDSTAQPSTHLEKLNSLNLADNHILAITSECTCCDNVEINDNHDTRGQNIFSCDLVYKFLTCLAEEERTDEVIAKIISLNPYKKYAAEYDVLKNFKRLLPEHRLHAIMGTLSPEDFAKESIARLEARLKSQKYQDSPYKAENLRDVVMTKIRSYSTVHFRFNKSSAKS